LYIGIYVVLYNIDKRDLGTQENVSSHMDTV
jgi:hypothetical protein